MGTLRPRHHECWPTHRGSHPLPVQWRPAWGAARIVRRNGSTPHPPLGCPLFDSAQPQAPLSGPCARLLCGNTARVVLGPRMAAAAVYRGRACYLCVCGVSWPLCCHGTGWHAPVTVRSCLCFACGMICLCAARSCCLDMAAEERPRATARPGRLFFAWMCLYLFAASCSVFRFPVFRQLQAPIETLLAAGSFRLGEGCCMPTGQATCGQYTLPPIRRSPLVSPVLATLAHRPCRPR